ncbi:Methionine aminopeptidase 1D/mitochondrial [Arachis hypogaea]|nr:Methionine aminopeptidase 1D/mitochondrial [Arachis hypogaea]
MTILIPLTEFREQEIMNKYAVQTDIETIEDLKLDSIVLGSRELSTIQRNVDELPGKRKRLRPGNVSPYREVPKDIPRPPHVKSKTPAGLVTGPEVHDEKGI